MRPQIIAFKCILKNKAGRLISQTYNREVLTTVDSNQAGILSGLNKNLQNIVRGEARRFSVRAEDLH